MNRPRRWILCALTASFLLVAVFTPLSRAHAMRISRGALLLPGGLLSFPPGVAGSALLRPPVMPAVKEQAGSGVIVGASYHNDTSPPSD